MQPGFFTLSESGPLGAAVCREAGLKLAGLEERSFEGGEFKLRPLESVRNRRVYVLQSLAGTPGCSAADRLVRLLFLVNGLRDAGAAELTAVIPYLAYARKDRRTQLRDPVNTRYVAQLLESAGVGRVLALDVHNPAAFDNSFRIPTDHLSALPMMADHFVNRLGRSDLVVVSPDVGGIKRAQLFREMLEARAGRPVELAFLEKRRALSQVATGRLVGDVNGRTVLIIDDLCATGGTLIRAAASCREAGAAAVHVAVTHVPLPAGVEAVAAAESITDMVTTDSVAFPDLSRQRTKVIMLSAGALLGVAIRRILSGLPVAPLLTRWPVPDDHR